MSIMVGMGMGMGTGTREICTSPYPIEKSGISHTHTHIQSMRGFSAKMGTNSDNTHETDLFVISTGNP